MLVKSLLNIIEFANFLIHFFDSSNARNVRNARNEALKTTLFFG